MTPVIDGETHHYEFGGLYDGVSILWDRESETYWHHVTGEALHGPLLGRRLSGQANLLHMTVRQALNVYPKLQVAISDRPIRGEQHRFWPWMKEIPGLPDRFRSTMAGEDTRRPTMDVGLGVWDDEEERYYPLEHVAAAGDFIIDELNARGLLVYLDPIGDALSAIYTEAGSAGWEDEALQLSTGEVIRGGILYGPDGERREMERPMQMFSRWYGYALIFPSTEVYEP